jgi:hypothetical protein
MFPTESGVPGDGSLIAIHGGSPATTEVIGGLILFNQAVEIYPQGGIGVVTRYGRKGEPLFDGGWTIWIEGSLNLDIHGDPTVSDYADMLSRWDTVRAKLLLIDYELFLYYHPSSPTTYRKLKLCNTYLLRCFWNNPVCMHYVFAAITADRTLYTTGPGL